jgi:HD-GYP domain-containing protein (c-di-GMP phosphodiesterase class II)
MASTSRVIPHPGERRFEGGSEGTGMAEALRPARLRQSRSLARARTAASEEPFRALLIIATTVLAAALALGAGAPGLIAVIEDKPIALAEFIVVACALALTPVEVYGRGSFTFAGAGLLATAFVLGVGAAIVTAAIVALVILIRSKGRVHRAAFNAGALALAASAGGIVFALLTTESSTGWAQLAAALVAGAAFLIVNIALICTAMGASEQIDPRVIWRERFAWLTPYYLASGALGLALAVAYERMGITGLAAFALPPAFMMLSIRQYLDRTKASVEEVRRANADLSDLLQVATGLAAHAHDAQALKQFSEDTLTSLAGARVHIDEEPSNGGQPLVAGGNTVAWLRTESTPAHAERWDRMRGAVASNLATALESALLVERVRKSSRDLVAALSKSMEAKDYYTGGHTERVAAISVALAERLGFQGEELEAIELGALVHDIGKVGVPETILNKPGPLDPEEWEVMKRHPVISDYILAEVDVHPFVRQAARSSHERIDGRGYPAGLSGEDIPMPARIVLLADAWDALTTDRPYRTRRSASEAVAEIRDNVGTQFCPVAFRALEDLYVARLDILQD